MREGRPGVRIDVCLYDDHCLGEPSGRFPVPLCDAHATRVHEMVEMTLALERMRERNSANLDDLYPNEPSEFRTYCDHVMASYGVQTGPEGSVYYARFGDMVKIGFSRNPQRRLAEIPHQEVLKVVPGTMLDERKAHAACNRWRITGEWFKDCPEFRAAAGLDTPPSDG